MPDMNHAGHDVMPEDGTFVFIRGVVEAQHVVMVFDWFDEVKQ